MSSYSSPAPSSLFDHNQGTPSSVSTYNPNTPSLVAVPLPHGQCSQGPVLHYLLNSSSYKYVTFDTAFPHHHAGLAPNINPNSFKEPAITPLVTRLRLRIPAVNLVFDVSNPRGVLVEDVFGLIFYYLQKPLSRDAYGGLPAPARETVDNAYKRRLHLAAVQKMQGISRELALVDCLGEKTKFFALSYARDGAWDVVLH